MKFQHLVLLLVGTALGLVVSNFNFFRRPSEKVEIGPEYQKVVSTVATPVWTTPMASVLPNDRTPIAANMGNTKEIGRVARVIDGDTIELVGGERVRYIGIDTPETVDPRKPVMCFGHEASARNKELVEGKEVRLVKDITDRDKYGRLLRYVYVGDLFINDALVREGYAHVYTYPPDVAMNERFLAAEREAREAGKGLWSACKDKDSFAATTMPIQVGPNGCTIKGNVNASGEKIYHTPGQKYYDKVKIESEKGEQWFCSEEEAQKAGWRKSKT